MYWRIDNSRLLNFSSKLELGLSLVEQAEEMFPIKKLFVFISFLFIFVFFLMFFFNKNKKKYFFSFELINFELN